MRNIDVFNGDADGICSLHQLRLAEPVDGVLVTGLKRDIGLLARVQGGPDRVVTVLDISLDRNRQDLLRLLSEGASVLYFDHHVAHDVPEHPRLQAYIDASPQVCTAILVDRYLQGRYAAWAVVAAFGDGLRAAAQSLADSVGLDRGQQSMLCQLGEVLNYNSYGETAADVLIHPHLLYGIVHRYEDPFELCAHEPVLAALTNRMDADLALAWCIVPMYEDAHCRVHRLPDAAWSRRVMGTFANRLADREGGSTCVVLKDNGDASLSASVRLPRAMVPEAADDADHFCRRFGGAGRKGAAGVDRLPLPRLDDFLGALRTASQRWAARCTTPAGELRRSTAMPPDAGIDPGRTP